MKTMLIALAAACAATGALLAVFDRGAGRPAPAGRVAAPDAVAAVEGAPKALPGEAGKDVKPGSRKALGTLALPSGRRLSLRTIETTDGETCLVDVEEPSLVAGSTCHKGGLFAHSRVVFSINLEGGPSRLAGVTLLGVAHPAVASVSLRTSDGEATTLELNEHGAFAYEAPAHALARDVVPAELVARGRNGRVLETIEIPPPR